MLVVVAGPMRVGCRLPEVFLQRSRCLGRPLCLLTGRRAVRVRYVQLSFHPVQPVDATQE